MSQNDLFAPAEPLDPAGASASTQTTVAGEAAHLRAVLNEHAHRYYVLDEPTIPTPNTTACSRPCRRLRPRTPSCARPIRPHSASSARCSMA